MDGSHVCRATLVWDGGSLRVLQPQVDGVVLEDLEEASVHSVRAFPCD